MSERLKSFHGKNLPLPKEGPSKTDCQGVFGPQAAPGNTGEAERQADLCEFKSSLVFIASPYLSKTKQQKPKPHMVWLACNLSAGELEAGRSEVQSQGWKEITQVKNTATLPEALGLILSIHMVAHNCNFGSKGSDVCLWPPRAPGTHVVHRHTYRQNTHTKEKNKTF